MVAYRLNPVEEFSIFTGFACLQPEDTDRDFDEFYWKMQSDTTRTG
jgi:hypothetical protein